MKRKQLGVTFLEVMAVVGLVAIVASISLPAIRNFLVQSSLTSVANNVVGALQMARSQAIRENANFTVVPDGTWNGGWCVVRGIQANCAGLPAASIIQRYDMVPTQNVSMTGNGVVTATRTGVFTVNGVVTLNAVNGSGQRVITYTRGGSVSVVRN